MFEEDPSLEEGNAGIPDFTTIYHIAHRGVHTWRVSRIRSNERVSSVVRFVGNGHVVVSVL